ncbi:MAG: CPBP family intramembrane metalloprotease [Planctomycetaceae bacterium]|nr:CPBP family intramembrane metalloprotease [Planctomycetaceae bacterium]
MASKLPGSDFPASDLSGDEPALPPAIPRQSAALPELSFEKPAIESVRDEVLSSESVWLADDEHPPIPQTQPVALEKRPVGPTLLESIAWMVGFYAVQFLTAFAAGVGFAVWFVLSKAVAGSTDGPGGKPFDMTSLGGDLQVYLEGRIVVIIAIAGLATVLYSAAAVSWRLKRRQGLRGLGLQPPSPVHVLLIFAGTFPLSVLCSELQRVLFTVLPQSESQMLKFLEQMGQAPFPLLLMVLAILPALGEELLFRGLIGHGLIDRMGVGWGVLVTSVLFGLLHFNPGQALAVMPLGVAMHFAYLVTRSFWAPVLLHFLNNALAAVMLKLPEELTKEAMLEGQKPTSVPILVGSAVLVAGIGYALWRTRVRSALEQNHPSPFDDGTAVPENAA